jgi:predicted phage tail protein
MVEIELLGSLKQFQMQLPPKINIKFATEAIRSIGKQIPEFVSELYASEARGYDYQLIIDDGIELEKETIERRIKRKLTIVPVVRGSSNVFKVITGVALIGLSLLVPAGILGVSASTIGSFGLALGVGGVVGMLTPTSDSSSTSGTNLDAGSGTRTVQGTPVPVIFGEVYVELKTILSSWADNGAVAVNFVPEENSALIYNS